MVWHITDDMRFEAEYMSGTLDVEGITSFRRSGYSILPSYFITDKVNLYFLYAGANPNHTVSQNSVVNIVPGVNIEVDDNVFIKADILNVRSQKNNTLYEGEAFSEFRAALSIGF